MNKIHVLTKISLVVDIAAIFALLIYFIVIAPYPPITGLGGLLILSPPLFGIVGIITAISGRKKVKAGIGTMLIIVNIIFLCWWPIMWYGGNLLFGV